MGCFTLVVEVVHYLSGDGGALPWWWRWCTTLVVVVLYLDGGGGALH